MNKSFIGKLFNEDGFLGSVFCISPIIVYTSAHCFTNIKDIGSCYIEFKGEKYFFSDIKLIEELDFVEIILEKEVKEIEFIPINTEYIYKGESFECFGYKEVDDEIVGVPMNVYEYPMNWTANDNGDYAFMIKEEEDNARWNGISGCPIFNELGIRGVVLKNYGGDGLKTRIKVISFNKIVNCLVDTEHKDIIENMPDRFVKSKLNERIKNNMDICSKLCYTKEYDFDSNNIKIIANFLKIDEGVNKSVIQSEVDNAIIEYALFLEEKYCKNGFFNNENIIKMMNRINSVKEEIGRSDNWLYILLWIFTEGIKGAPRVGRLFICDDSNYAEEDIYYKRDGERIKLLIPIVASYENIFKSIINILEHVIYRKNKNFLEVNEIEWDGQAINCLDIKSSAEIGKISRGEYLEKIDIEITALGIYSTDLYENIPIIAKTTERIIKFMDNKFLICLNNIEGKNKVIKMNSEIEEININLFILPVNNINDLKR